MQIMRKFEFDAGHRILNHESKCRHLHGHRYVAEVYIEAPDLDSLGRVIDFGLVKDVFGKCIDTTLDHNLILHRDDPLLEGGNFKNPEAYMDIITRRPIILPENPTAENIAKHLMFELELRLAGIGEPYDKLDIPKLVLWETPNCCAIYEPGKEDRR